MLMSASGFHEFGCEDIKNNRKHTSILGGDRQFALGMLEAFHSCRTPNMTSIAAALAAILMTSLICLPGVRTSALT